MTDYGEQARACNVCHTGGHARRPPQLKNYLAYVTHRCLCLCTEGHTLMSPSCFAAVSPEMTCRSRTQLPVSGAADICYEAFEVCLQKRVCTWDQQRQHLKSQSAHRAADSSKQYTVACARSQELHNAETMTARSVEKSRPDAE